MNGTTQSQASGGSTGGSFLDFTPVECQVIFYGFLTGSIFGSLFHVLVLGVLGFKLVHECVRSPADLLMLHLTLIDLTACGVLFPVEATVFWGRQCNRAQTWAEFGLTFWLEASSTIALLNIAINRYVMVCRATQLNMTFRVSGYMCLANTVLSSLMAAVAVVFRFSFLAMLIYILTLCSIMLLMALLYSLIYRKLWTRALASKRRRRQHPNPSRATQSEVLQHSANHTTAQPTNQEEASSMVTSPQAAAERTQMERMMWRSAKIFIVITSLYVICFLPNALLTTTLFIQGTEFYVKERSSLEERIIRSVNMFYNINFVLMPVVYAALSRQFWADARHLVYSLFPALDRRRVRAARKKNSSVTTTTRANMAVCTTGGGATVTKC